MSICTCRFEVMMFCATVRVNIQKIKVINLECCYELRRIRLFFYTPRVFFTNISTCHTDYSSGPSALFFVLNRKF
jgi:hypothetical protein